MEKQGGATRFGWGAGPRWDTRGFAGWEKERKDRDLTRQVFFLTNITLTCSDICTNYLMVQTNTESDKNMLICLRWCFPPTVKGSKNLEQVRNSGNHWNSNLVLIKRGLVN